MLDAYVHKFRDSARSITTAALLTFGLALFATGGEAAAETRSLKLYNTHTHERAEITFKKNGRFVSSGLRELNHFLRDWRRNESTKMDPELFDLIWEVYKKSGTSQPIHVVSGYRSPATNNMLRSRSRGVAKNSQHTRGKAMDFFIPGFDLAKLRALGLRKEVGGVGFYPTSGSPFVHMDTGSVRHWPRMTRSQLAKVFPDGVTIHIPSDGKPMPGYQQALARHKKGGPATTLVAANDELSTKGQSLTNVAADQGAIIRPGSSSTGKGFLASLFAGDGDAGDDSGAPAESTAAEETKVRVAAVRPESTADNALPGVKAAASQAGERSSSDKDATVAIAAPPVPVQKETPADAPEAQATTIVANAFPRSKPAREITVAEAPAAPGTLDAQAQRLRSGKPAIETGSDTLGGFIQTASAAETLPPAAPERFEPTFNSRPQQKPAAVLALAAASQGATPRPSPANGVAAIAAATRGDAGRKGTAQASLASSVLAYGAAPATTGSLTNNEPSVAGRTAAAGSQPSGATPARAGGTSPSLSGQVPIAPIEDPLAQFAALPDRAATPGIMSGRVSTKAMAFASFSHPNQRQLGELLATANRILPVRFEKVRKWPLAESFEGEAVVLLPVMSIR